MGIRQRGLEGCGNARMREGERLGEALPPARREHRARRAGEQLVRARRRAGPACDEEELVPRPHDQAAARRHVARHVRDVPARIARVEERRAGRAGPRVARAVHAEEGRLRAVLVPARGLEAGASARRPSEVRARRRAPIGVRGCAEADGAVEAVGAERKLGQQPHPVPRGRRRALRGAGNAAGGRGARVGEARAVRKVARVAGAADDVRRLEGVEVGEDLCAARKRVARRHRLRARRLVALEPSRPGARLRHRRLLQRQGHFLRRLVA